MSPAALLADLQARGVTVEARGDRLRVEAPAGMLTPDLKAQLAAHKPALLALLDPAARSGWCGHRRLWLSVHGRLVCGVCHPPAPGALAEWLDWTPAEPNRS